MEITWYEKLEQQYIHLFETYEDGKVIRGIECGPGWEKHIIELLNSLDWYCKNNNYINNPNYNPDIPAGSDNPVCIPRPDGDNKIKIFQIKEKFGQARVYWSTDNPKITNLIEKTVGRFEGKCSITCQHCGTLEYDCIKQSKSGWIYCLCEKCFNEKRK